MPNFIEAFANEMFRMSKDKRGQSGTGLIGLAIIVVVSFLVIVQLVSGTALATNSLVVLVENVFIPVGLLVGAGKIFGFL